MPCPVGNFAIVFSLEFSGVPTGMVWSVGQYHKHGSSNSEENFEVTLERIIEEARGLYGLTPDVSFQLKFLDDDGQKLPLATPGDLDNAFSYWGEKTPMRVMVDVPVPPGTPLPPFPKEPRRQKCEYCKKVIRGQMFTHYGHDSQALCGPCFWDKRTDLREEQWAPVPLPNEPEQWIRKVSRVQDPQVCWGVKCTSCGKSSINGIRWRCCECPGDKVNLCETCYHRKPHNPAHHMCPLDEKMEKEEQVNDYVNGFLQAVSCGAATYPGAASMMLGMQRPGEAPKPMMGMMAPAGGSPAPMMGMPGMMPPQQMGMPAGQPMMPGMPPAMGSPMPSGPAMPVTATVQCMQAGPTGQPGPCTMTFTWFPLGAPLPPPVPGTILINSPGSTMTVTINNGAPLAATPAGVPSPATLPPNPVVPATQQPPASPASPQQASSAPCSPAQQQVPGHQYAAPAPGQFSPAPGMPQQQQQMPGMPQQQMPGMPQQQMPGMPQQQMPGMPQQQMQHPGMPQQQQQMPGMPQQQMYGYPPQQQGYGYPPQQQQQMYGYPPQQQGYGYPPQQQQPHK